MKSVLFALVLFVGSQASAKLSYCENLKVLEGLKNGWKLEKTELETTHNLSFNDRLFRTKNISARGLRLLYMIDKDGSIDPRNKELISQVKKIFDNVKKDAYTKDSTVKMLSFTLPKLQGAIDNAVFHGQLKGNCDTGLGKAVQMDGVKSAR